MISREYLTNLKKISKIFGNGMPFESFACVDESHVSMLSVITNNHYGNRKYMFSMLPDTFIQDENIVAPRDYGCGIEINNLTLAIDTECDRNFHNRKSINIDWDKTNHTTVVIDGKILKSFIMDDDYTLTFICDYKSTRIESQIKHNVPKLSYGLDKATEGEPFESSFKMWAIKRYRTLIPNRLINVTFGDEYPVVFDWEDDMGNEYRILIAPCVWSD